MISKFCKAAETYDQFADLQNNVSSKLASMLSLTTDNSSKIIDIGCGTGNIVYTLSKKYKRCIFIQLDLSWQMISLSSHKNQSTYSINANLDYIPISRSSLDIAFSAMTLHWTPDLRHSCNTIAQILKNEGLFYCAIPLNNTFSELNKIKDLMNIKRYSLPSLSYVMDAFSNTSFNILDIKTINYKYFYPSCYHFLKSLKNTGTNTSSQIVTVQQLRELMEKYDQAFYELGKGIPVSWEIAYLTCSKY